MTSPEPFQDFGVPAEPCSALVPADASGTALAEPLDRVRWTVAAALQARVTRDGFLFVVTIEQVGGDWFAIGIVTPELEEAASIAEKTAGILDQHAHQMLSEKASLMEAMSVAELWLVTARAPTELCECEEVG